MYRPRSSGNSVPPSGNAGIDDRFQVVSIRASNSVAGLLTLVLEFLPYAPPRPSPPPPLSLYMVSESSSKREASLPTTVSVSDLSSSRSAVALLCIASNVSPTNVPGRCQLGLEQDSKTSRSDLRFLAKSRCLHLFI